MNQFQLKLIEFIRFLQTIEPDVSLINYERLVHEKPPELHENLFMNIFKVYRTEILSANFEWLKTKEIKISFGKSGKSCIKLSQLYKKASNDQKIQIEALFIFCIIECLKDQERNQVVEVSKKYVLTEDAPNVPIFGELDNNGKDLFGSIVGKLKDKFEESGVNTGNQNVNTEDIGKVINTLMNDQQLQNDIFKFAQQINLPSLLGNLFPQKQ